MPEDVKLSPCPMCGEKAEVGEYYGESLVFCTGCGVQTRSTRKEAAVAAWNRRAPESGTSVVRWVAYDGTPETLPEDGFDVVVADDTGDSFYASRQGMQWRHPAYEIGGISDGFRCCGICLGDRWAYLPTPEG